MKIESRFDIGDGVYFIDENRVHDGEIVDIIGYRDNDFLYRIKPNNPELYGTLQVKECNTFLNREEVGLRIFETLDYSKEDISKPMVVEYITRVEVDRDKQDILDEIPFMIEDCLTSHVNNVLCVEK